MGGLPISPIILAVVAFAGIVGTAFMLAYGSAADRRLRKRMDQVLLLEGPSTAPAAVGPARADQRTSSLKAGGKKTRSKSIDEKLRQILPNLSRLRLKLERAAIDMTVSTLLLLVLGLIVGLTLFFALYGNQSWLVSIMAGIGLGIFIPTLVIGIRGKKRAMSFLVELPDAIDLIVRSVRSGLPVSEAIHAIARDMEGIVAEEFKTVSDQMRIGISMDDALGKSVERLGLTDYAFLTVSLSITRRTGGNLSETLANLSRLLRSRHQMLLKIRALSSEARASAMIIGILPFVVMGALLILNPEYINTLFTEPEGQDVLLFAGVSMGMGFGVMAKLVRFDF